ncbi:DUF2884 family protein [Montanilutibacter psychrotolerans]|uniref:DUF2884 family protein n=1 Tax=Montanilutibacter psychrotolerans TaxID=1327343 RepID=A0A3M8SLL7_9GAMM|nr:DUF2884 family protein [Lysobacter psychrotolerans]RNF82201.1 DUF2884 family protein [Lysobacter psychrotolerans]
MRRVATIVLLSMAAHTALAGNKGCDVKSDYHLTLNDRSLILTRDPDTAVGQPHAIVMRQGRMFVDNRWVQLSAEDSRRIADFETGARAAMPEAQAIGRDAARIAFDVLGEVAAGFTSNPRLSRSKLDAARSRLDARLARSVTPTRFSNADLGDGIGDAVGEVLPSLLGDVIGGAVTAALSGDSERLQRMSNIEDQLDRRIKPLADALEARAMGLCQRMIELDRLEDSLAFRQPGGQSLQLLRVELEPPKSSDN